MRGKAKSHKVLAAEGNNQTSAVEGTQIIGQCAVKKKSFTHLPTDRDQSTQFSFVYSRLYTFKAENNALWKITNLNPKLWRSEASKIYTQRK
jgi:hypothetical protein